MLGGATAHLLGAGFAFASHQVGSFLGAYLGGVVYDKTGSYDIMWYVMIGAGVASALINLPISNEKHSLVVRHERLLSREMPLTP